MSQALEGARMFRRRAKLKVGRGSPVVWFGPQCQVVLTLRMPGRRFPGPVEMRAQTGDADGSFPIVGGCEDCESVALSRKGNGEIDGGRRRRGGQGYVDRDVKCAVAKP